MVVPDPEKGARYLAQLDQALCGSNWAEIPELARKVEKHAPERKCLTLAARAEAQIASASHRPASASSTTEVSIHRLGEAAPKLSEAIAAAGATYPDDAYAANTALAAIHWLQQDPISVLSVLDHSAAPTTTSNTKPAALGWLEVCAVKRTFLRADALDSSARQAEARACYQYAVSRTPGYRSAELRTWTERLLARACLYSVKNIPSPSLQDLSVTYTAFRAWGEFWQRAAHSSAGGASHVDTPRRRVWKEYYDMLLIVLQHDLLFNQSANASADSLVPTGALSAEQRVLVRLRQRAEVKLVEETYESLLINETKFPKSRQANLEVEEWVEQVIGTWRILTGPSWTDAELGEGGKQALSRNVLNILYRAAMKTFHSTAILRQLFTVHASLGEFDLAMRAFDSYVQIVDKGKARAVKTGEHELGFDDDNLAILTAAEAIRVLCQYGDQEQAEKANGVRKTILKWLGQPRPSNRETAQSSSDDNRANGLPPADQNTASALKPQSLGAAHRAIGICQAHWSHVTYDDTMRSKYMHDALTNLQRAQKSDEQNIETAFALARVLAEMQDLTAAIEVIRAAVTPADPSLMTDERRRQSLPLWHLLALCLTGLEQLESAAEVCENTIEQSHEPAVTDSGLLQVNGEKETSPPRRRNFDAMQGFDKESLLEIKITQIALLEEMKGPEEAASWASELSALYARLFGEPDEVFASITPRPPKSAFSATPSRSKGTLRSIAGSIRPRSIRSVRTSIDQDIGGHQTLPSSGVATPIQPVPATNGESLGPPIAITVTNEEGVDAEKSHGHHHHRLHLPFRSHRHGGDSVQSGAESHGDVDPISTNGDATEKPRPDQPIGEMAHNTAHDASEPAGHDDQPPRQDIRLPAAHPAASRVIPEPLLSSTHERRYKVNVLIKVWLCMAELYVHAGSLEDAQSTIDDAFKLVELLEMDLAASEDGTSAKKLYRKGWGSSKSVDETWADAWSIKAHIASASAQPLAALEAYEQALFHFPDHPDSIVALSNLLLDMYDGTLSSEPGPPVLPPLPTTSGAFTNEAQPTTTAPEPTLDNAKQLAPKTSSPAELNRLAARDRAYMLLDTLTHSGAGRQDSEAWLALARAHECSGEIGQAKTALQRVLDLEERRPVRGWRQALGVGFVL